MRTLLPLLVLSLAPAAAAQLQTVRVASGLARPTFATHAPGDTDRLFITEQFTAQVRILDLNTETLNPAPFLDLNPLVVDFGNESGLLGLAFHPDYATNGRFFVSYNREPDGVSVVDEFQVSADPDVADFATRRTVLTVPQPQANHNGGWIGFGPGDGYLYLALGDGGNGCDFGTGHTPGIGNAQDLTDNLLGKILRLDVDGALPYGIPPDNPFVGVSGDDEIWAYGLRNPWRCSFDRLTGDLYIGDVGQSNAEEIDFQSGLSTGGENYGWPCEEGLSCASDSPSLCGAITGCNCPSPTAGFVAPVLDYLHEPPPSPASYVCAVTGGYVYRGSAIPSLQGTYFFADYCGFTVWSFEVVGGVATNYTDRTAELVESAEGHFVTTVTSFGEDANGELYLLDQAGEVFRIEAEPPTMATVVSNNGQGINLDVQSAPPAILGQPWSASVTVNDPSHPATGLLVLFSSPTSLATGPRLTLAGGPTTELLISASGLAQPCPPFQSYAAGTGTACPGVTIPFDAALVGTTWCTQVAVGSPAAGFTLTNSLCGTVGTF